MLTGFFSNGLPRRMRFVSFFLLPATFKNLVVIAALLLACFPRVAGAQPATTPSHFEKILDTLSQRHKLTLIAEGFPRMAKVSPEDYRRLTKETLTVEESLKELGNAFDYDFTLQQPVCLLRKRYTAGNEVPCVTMEECRRALEQIEKLASTLSPEINVRGMDPLVLLSQKLVASLTEEMIHSSAEKPIPIANVGTQTRDMMGRILLYETVSIVGEIARRPLIRFNQASKATMTVAPFNGQNALGFMTDAKDASKFIPLTNGELSGTATPENGYIPSQFGVTTLSSAVTALASKEGITYEVDPILAEKPLTIKGANLTNSETLFQSYATLYGLRVVTVPGTTSTKRITTFGPTYPVTPNNYKASIRRAFSAPLARALEVKSKPTASEIEPLFPEQRWNTLVHAAVKQLRYVVDKSPERIPFTSLNTSERAAFAIAEMYQVLQNLQRVLTYDQESLQRFDQLYLSVKLSGTAENTRANIDFLLPQADGTHFQTAASYSVVRSR